MKKYFYFILILFSLTFLTCDKIENPCVPGSNSAAGCPTPVFPPKTPVQKVLVEDYTGHRCIACPPAAVALETIEGTYPQQVIGVGVHANFWAEPSPCMNPPAGLPSYAFYHYLGCPATENYFNVFNPPSNPKGMVNRVHIGVDPMMDYSQWSSVVDTLIDNIPAADINIFTNYDVATRKLCVACKTTFLKSMTGTYNLAILFVEDSIIDWQSFSGTSDSTYIFRNVVRDDINGAGTGFGEQIVSGNIAVNDTVVKSYSYTVPSGFQFDSPLCTNKPTLSASPCDYKKCYVVAFIFDNNSSNSTYREILQAEIKKIWP